MAIPLVDLKAQYLSISGRIDEAISRVLVRSNFILGEEVAQLEKEFASYCGTKEAVGVSSGTEALRLALLALGIGPGDEVITTPFTFIANVEAIVHVGATPVFADISPQTCNIDPKAIALAITPKTRAIIPVHLYGRVADMDEIMRLARKHNLVVIEDAAQAHGARRNGRRAGSIGDVGCFSFYPGKNLGAYGDAGMIVTSSPEIAQKVRLLRDHGRSEKYEHTALGYNSRLDGLQAAILRVKLTWLDNWNSRRRRIAQMYRDLLQVCDLQYPLDEPTDEPVYHLFVIRTPQRAQLRRALAAVSIATGIHYPIPLHLQPALQYMGHQRGDFLESEKAASEVLSLPIYPEMTEEQVVKVADTVKETLRTLSTLYSSTGRGF